MSPWGEQKSTNRNNKVSIMKMKGIKRRCSLGKKSLIVSLGYYLENNFYIVIRKKRAHLQISYFSYYGVIVNFIVPMTLTA